MNDPVGSARPVGADAIRFVDDFRDRELSLALVDRIRPAAQRIAAERGLERVAVMEVCGGHTHTLFRFGIHQALRDVIEFVHGPGCPVCVLPRDVIAQCVSWAQREDMIVATFGDAIRVPGHGLTLQQARAAGANVQVVYSPLEALETARENPDKNVVFLALGFDTTMPSTALTLLTAKEQGVTNFSLYAVHIGIIPTLQAVLAEGAQYLQGLIGPGHVSMVIGSQPYEFVARDYGLPFVISGFEPLDLLQSLNMILAQLERGEAKVENQYARTVTSSGNAAALAAINRVFRPEPRSFWQGLGGQTDIGYVLSDEFAEHDAEKRFGIDIATDPLSVAEQPPECDQVIMGRLSPPDCPHFNKGCTQDHPLGALMVSNEGACAAWYHAGAMATT